LSAENDEYMNIMVLLQQKWGVPVSDCESTTGWTSPQGTLATAGITANTTPPNANFVEPGSYELKVTGNADSNGQLSAIYTLGSTTDFQNGPANQEYEPGWLQYVSLWIKAYQAGTIRLTLTDVNSKTAHWDTAFTAGLQEYVHNLIGTYTGNDSGFDITQIASIQVGYVSQTQGTALEFHVDGIRVQGPPTYDSFKWCTFSVDTKLGDQVIGVGPIRQLPTRIRGPVPERSETFDPWEIGPVPLTERLKPIAVGYQFIPDGTSARSEGLCKVWRYYTVRELTRILLKNPRALASKGIRYLFTREDLIDDELMTHGLMCRGYIFVDAQHFMNVVRPTPS
jgi:hypothetical protein